MDHDQNFKNLILDYPREALLFVLEEESETRRFSIHRLAHYCLDLAELFGTDRVVPVVIFLRGGSYPRELILGGRRHTYLSFRYLVCTLAEIPFERYCESDNIVARLNLPNMRYPRERKVEAYAQAVRGLTRLEPALERQLKYLDFIDIYAGLDDNELEQYRHGYPEEAEKMTTFAERFRRQGMQQGMQKGVQQGEALILVRQLKIKFGELPEERRLQIESADTQTLLEWSERVLTAKSLEEVLH